MIKRKHFRAIILWMATVSVCFAQSLRQAADRDGILIGTAVRPSQLSEENYASTLAREFNCREGFTPEDDVLPQRLHEGIGNGALKGQFIDPDQFFAARRTYYEMAGWDPNTGRPTDSKLAELGVEGAAAGR